MANQPESAVYDAGVFQLETTTAVQGGVGGASNAPLLNLADRTAYLKAHVDALEAAASGMASLNDAIMTGNFRIPDVALGDRSTKGANTDFVQDTMFKSQAVNVAGNTNVVLSSVQAGAGILNLSGLLTGNIAVVVPNTVKFWIIVNGSTGAFTITVKTAAGTGIVVSQGKTTILYCDATNVIDGKTDFLNAVLLGTPTTPTAPAGTNTTQVASAAFARQVKAGLVSVPVGGNVDVALTQSQWGVALVILTGALTGNINVTVPAASDQWLFSNQTSGAFSVTVKTLAGTGVVVPQAQTQNLWCDGTNVNVVSGAFDTTYSLVRKPTIQFPVAASTLVGTTPYVQGNAYYSLYQVLQGAAQFQVSLAANFAVNAVDSGSLGPVNAFQVPSGALATNTGYYVRGRYQDLEGAWSPWSDAVFFTTGAQAVNAPTITAPANAAVNVGDGFTMSASAFSMATGIDTHGQTDWEIWTGTGGTGTLVFSSYADTVNLTSIVVPGGTVAPNTTYYPRARYAGVSTGYSPFSASVSFQTAASFAAVLSPGGAYGGGFFAGYVIISGQRYALIVSDANGHTPNGDLSSGGAAGVTSAVDGKANTAAYVANGRYSGGNDAVAFVKRYNGGGYNDWYLAAKNELEIIYRNLKPTTTLNVTTSGANPDASPAATGNYTTTVPAQTAATSFQDGGVNALNRNGRDVGALTFVAGTGGNTYSQGFDNGAQTTHWCGRNMNYRAIRRIAA